MQVSAKRFSRLGEDSNFWAMGDTGPCGPCSEIFYDHGPKVKGGPPGSKNEDGDRYVEIWNLVFMQYNRDKNGKLTRLPKPSVDTGMGLERIAAVMQGVHDNYEIDVFQELIKAAAKVLKVDVKKEPTPLRVIADHVRAASFMIADGIYPGNEGRGYVLRRIIRRAVRYGFRLEKKDPFLFELVGAVIKQMGKAYPLLVESQVQIERVLQQEETRFGETLDRGLNLLDEHLGKGKKKLKKLSGSLIFKLYDTYGFPVDLTRDIAIERKIELDMKGFEKEMEAQRERARAASTFKVDAMGGAASDAPQAEFTGYDTIQDKTIITAIQTKEGAVQQLKKGGEGIIYLQQTPFYAESGGQVGDQGALKTKQGEFTVQDTQKGFAHIGVVKEGAFRVGDDVQALVDQERRHNAAYNHSATHLLHAALRDVLGKHVTQKGSLVAPDRLRFDFTHFEPVTREQLREIERLVNEEIRNNYAVQTDVMAVDEARDRGAIALFGEKYGERVRVVSMGQFSCEFCGGTHVNRTGDIGLFKITQEGGVAAGVRRIEAVTAQGALDAVNAAEALLQEVATKLKTMREDIPARIDTLYQQVKDAEKALVRQRQQQSSDVAQSLEQVESVAGVNLVRAQMDDMDVKELRETMDRLKDKLKSGVIILAGVREGKISLICGVTKDLTGRLHAGKLVDSIAREMNGKGGGRPDLGQAGSQDTTRLEAAWKAIPAVLEASLAGLQATK